MNDKQWEEIKYFKSSEFDSNDEPGSGKNMNFDLVKILDKARQKIGRPLVLHSGMRSVKHNAEVGGVSESAHTMGMAADIDCPDSQTRFDLINIFLEFGIRRLGIGKNFLHIDIDPDKPQSVVWLYP